MLNDYGYYGFQVGEEWPMPPFHVLERKCRQNRATLTTHARQEKKAEKRSTDCLQLAKVERIPSNESELRPNSNAREDEEAPTRKKHSRMSSLGSTLGMESTFDNLQDMIASRLRRVSSKTREMESALPDTQAEALSQNPKARASDEVHDDASHEGGSAVLTRIISRALQYCADPASIRRDS